MDMIKNLLTAQNFSMPGGYVTEDGIDYLVRVGDKPATLEELKALPLMDLPVYIGINLIQVICVKYIRHILQSDHRYAVHM